MRFKVGTFYMCGDSKVKAVAMCSVGTTSQECVVCVTATRQNFDYLKVGLFDANSGEPSLSNRCFQYFLKEIPREMVDLKLNTVQVEDLLHIIRCYDKIALDGSNSSTVQVRVKDLSDRLLSALKGN